MQRDLGRRRLALAREGMARPDRRRNRISGERPNLEVASLQGELGIRDQEVEVASEQCRQQRVGVSGTNRHLHTRMGWHERLEHGRKQAQLRLRVDADRDLARADVLPQRNLLLQLPNVSQEIVAPLDQPLPELCQDQPASAPVEELRAELLLEAGDALRQRRLGQVEGVGGGLHRRVRGHREQVSVMDRFETRQVGPRLRPCDPATAFCSLLFEDLFDEWFWRPALYYRWAFDEDARLMSNQLARTMLRDVPLPLFLRRRFILHRQRLVYLKKDGVTKQTARAIEALYMDALRELDAIFSHRPFLFGDRPCEADFGLFGPFFRHFFCDPTSGALMREHAPHVSHWVTRLWKTRPADLEGAAAVSGVPDDLGFFFEMAANDYLPYLEANAQAVATGAKNVRYDAQGVAWEIPSAPYRAECFNELKRRFAALDRDAAIRVAGALPAGGIELLRGPTTAVEIRTDRRGLRGRLGRPASVFD
jgi:glutathione S-transferase